jgi:vitamin K-dependent gamma-carboxylase-like protein
MRTWLAARPDVPLLGRWAHEEWAAYAASYGGLLLDLLVVPAVLWRRTRIPALGAAVAFHLINRELFSLRVFPYLAMAGLLLCCAPSWPRDLLGRVGVKVGQDTGAQPPPRPLAAAALIALAVYLAVQLLVPLRHHLDAGDPNWTEAGHTFAWHMKLRDKWGQASFVVRDPASGQVWTVDPAMLLSSWQEAKMANPPGADPPVQPRAGPAVPGCRPPRRGGVRARVRLAQRAPAAAAGRPDGRPRQPARPARPPPVGAAAHRAAAALTRRRNRRPLATCQDQPMTDTRAVLPGRRRLGRHASS